MFFDLWPSFQLQSQPQPVKSVLPFHPDSSFILKFLSLALPSFSLRRAPIIALDNQNDFLSQDF